MFVHAVKELQKAIIEYQTLKKRFFRLETKLVAAAQRKVSVPAKRRRKKTDRYQPSSIDLTTNEGDNLSDTDTGSVETLVPVKVEQEKIPKKKKKKKRAKQ